jgi:uncharacterized protein (TIGR03790 family)
MVGMFPASPALLSLLCAGALGGCNSVDAKLNEWTGKDGEALETQAAAPTADSKRVLIVINETSQASKEIGVYYRVKRGVPTSNVLFVNVPENEEISTADYQKKIETPVREIIRKQKGIDFIVLTKGVPIRLVEGGFAVDAFLAAMDLGLQPIAKLEEADIMRCANPYFEKDEPFSAAKFKMFLVTRLDGYTIEDAKKLVDNSLAAKPDKGPFFFDEADNRKGAGYVEMQKTLGDASKALGSKGFESELEQTGVFKDPGAPVMGYASWGSNDGAFDLNAYKAIRFKPGALCETFVSTSGRTFLPTSGGQSLIADLIANGVTGVKGYVSEPYTFALARPDILFPRYVSGRNLAESFYSASLVVKWKDVVIGDPLCSPYGAK